MISRTVLCSRLLQDLQHGPTCSLRLIDYRAVKRTTDRAAARSRTPAPASPPRAPPPHTHTNMSTVPKMTPAMRRQMKKAQVAKLTSLGQDVPDYLQPTPLNVCASPTKYPIKICTFTKLFWQTSTNVRFDLFRLNPQIYPSTLCLIPTDIDKGVELNRLYFDQMLLEILVQPAGADNTGLASRTGMSLGPIKERGGSSLQEERRKSLQKSAAGGGEQKQSGRKTLRRPTNKLDLEGPAITRFLDKKLNMKRPLKPAPLAVSAVAAVPVVAEAATVVPSEVAAADAKVVTAPAAETQAEASAAANAEAEPAARKSPPKLLSLKTSDSFTLSQSSQGSIEHAFSPAPVTPPVVVEQVISIRGIATTSTPVAVANANGEQARGALVPVRGRATSYNSFKNLHREMENNLSAVRRNSKVVEKSARAVKLQIMIMSQFSQMRMRSTPKAGDSKAKSRWKKACHRVIMDMAVERTRAHLLRNERMTIS